jgi:SNF2 family DNA or RNA helicase
MRISSLSPKEEALLDLLDNELAGEKVLVFTKSRKWIDRFEWLCKNGHFTERKFLRITGKESEAQRAENKKLFQTSEDHNLMFINAAIMEGANLQQSAHMILLDAPWGWGALIQLVGRMVRMYSPHLTNTLHVMVMKGTIDEYVIDTLKGKKGVFEKILGESHSTGLLDAGLDAGADLDLAAGMETLNDEREFKELLKAHVKTTVMSKYLSGSLLQEAKDEDYVMSFEKEEKRSNKVTRKFEFSDRWMDG